MVRKALTDPEADEKEIECAPHLLNVILQHCKGRVDACIPTYVALLHDR